MLEYFPCMVDKSVKEAEMSKDNSIREPSDSKLMAKNEEPNATDAHKTSPPKPNTTNAKKESCLRGREKAYKKTGTELQSTLLWISPTEIRTKDLKNEDSKHVQGVKKDDSGAGKIDTFAKIAEGAVERVAEGTAESAVSGTVQSTADGKGKEHSRKLNSMSLQ